MDIPHLLDLSRRSISRKLPKSPNLPTPAPRLSALKSGTPNRNPADAPELHSEGGTAGASGTDMMDAVVGLVRVVHAFLWGGLAGVRVFWGSDNRDIRNLLDQ